MKAGILTRGGMNLLNREIVQFEPTKTTVVAKPIATPFRAAVVTANVGHIPRSNLKVGFSATKPLVNSLLRPILPRLWLGVYSNQFTVNSEKVEEYQITRLSDGESQLSEGQIEKIESGILNSHSGTLMF